MQRQHAVGDRERRQRDVGRHIAGRGQRLGEALPVPTALRIERQTHERPLKLDLVGFDDAPEQRRNGKLDAEAVRLEEGELARGIRDADLLESEIGERQQVQLHIAVDLHLAADGARCLGLEVVAIAVPVDEIGYGEQSADNGYDEDSDGDEQVVHRPAPMHSSHCGQGSGPCRRASSSWKAPNPSPQPTHEPAPSKRSRGVLGQAHPRSRYRAAGQITT